MNTKRQKIAWGAFFALGYIGLGAMLYRMFLRQAIAYPGPLGIYDTDLRAHIREGRAGTGYSLMEYAFGFLMGTLKLNEKAVAVFLALVALATIWTVFRLMRKLTPEGCPQALHLLAFVSAFVMPVYVKALNPYRYLGLQSATIWHNATYTGMKLAGMGVLFFYFSYQETYLKRFPVRSFVWFTVLLSVANMVKPNFIICFAPAMAVMLLADCIASRGRTLPRQILFGIPVLLSLAVLLTQSAKLFGESGSGSSVAFSMAYILRLRTRHPIASLLQSAAFPLLVLAANFRSLKTDRRFRASWLIWLFGLLEFLFLNETGERMDHGNLSWGYSYCLFLVFVVCLCWLYKNVLELYRDYQASGTSGLFAYIREKAPGRGVYLAAAVLLLCWHLFCGLQYSWMMYLGHTFLC